MLKHLLKKRLAGCWAVMLCLCMGIAMAENKDDIFAAVKAGDMHKAHDLLAANPGLV
jgi:hypothetical protein